MSEVALTISPIDEGLLERTAIACVKAHLGMYESLRLFKTEYVIQLLREYRGNQFQAAKGQGIHRNTLSRAIQELHIDVRALRAGHRKPPHTVAQAPKARKPHAARMPVYRGEQG